jgi:hypothetical protein
MSKETTSRTVARWHGEFFSARYFWVRALALVLLFATAHFAGLREYTTFLSGTTGSPDVGIRLSAFYGMLYITLYIGCVVVAPVLILAAGILTLWQKFGGRTHES